MIEVVVLIDNFRDKSNINKKINVIRNGKEIELYNKLLQKGDIYSISKERFNHLSKKNIVAKHKKEKEDSTEK